MTRQRLASGFLRASGLLMMLLGVIHLIATPHITHLLDGMTASSRAFAAGPTTLNHVLVGVLLLPLGFATWTAAAADSLAHAWAKRILTANTLAFLALPIAVLICMRQPEYYQAPLFVGAVVLTIATSLLVAFATWVGISSEP